MPERLVVRFDRGRLWVKSQGASLKEIAEAISRQAGINITLSGALERIPVAVDVSGSDLETGLRQILREAGVQNHAWVYRPDPSPLRPGSWAIEQLRIEAAGSSTGQGGPSAEKRQDDEAVAAPPNAGLPAATAGKGGPKRESYFDPRAGRFVDVAAREVLVRFRKDMSDAEIEQVIRGFSAQVIRRYPRLGLYRLRLPDTESVSNFIQKTQGHPDLIRVEPNPLATTMANEVTPNDPLFAGQWALRKIEAPKAWAITTGRPEVIVAVIDTGIDQNHVDLAGQVLPREPRRLAAGVQRGAAAPGAVVLWQDAAADLPGQRAGGEREAPGGRVRDNDSEPRSDTEEPATCLSDGALSSAK
ncbi:MAG: hypothetical protein HYU42_08160 [Candidatus Rokubacteria bacterium]|nr:hypothetical protein [Candidatus Rokubacteria bacterium]